VRWLVVAIASGIGWKLGGPWVGLGLGAVGSVMALVRGRSAVINAARTHLTQQIGDHDNLHFDGELSYFTLTLPDGIPRIASLTPGRGGVMTGDRDFDARVALIGDAADWIPLLNRPIRQTLCDIQPVRFDSTTQTLIIEADTSYEHGTFPDRIKQARVCVDALRALAGEPKGALLDARLAEAQDGAERLVIFKTLWHADRRSAQALAAQVRDPAIRYFVATASTPPDRDTIEAIVFDDAVDGAVRTEASLRWFGLVTGIYDLFDADAPLLIAAPAAAKHFEPLIDVWAQSAPDSEQALTLLGRFGRPEHAVVLGTQRNGPHGEAARDALAQLKDRFPDLQHGGQLAISSMDAGQLELVDPTDG
jgi:hypothetical protein